MIAFLTYDIAVRGGTHKQLLKLLDYCQRSNIEFIVIAKYVNLEQTYPGFSLFKDRIFEINYEFKRPLIFKIKGLRKFAKIYSYSLYTHKLKRKLANVNIINIHDGGWENELPLLKRKKIFWQVNDLPPCFRVGAHSNLLDTKEYEEERKKIISYSKYVDEFIVNVSKNASRIKLLLNRDSKVFYCGVEPLSINRDINASLERFTHKQINILTSGVFFPYRNYETQIKVIKKLNELGFDANLHIIGALMDTEYAKKIQSLIKDNDLEEKITIDGQVDEAKFKQLHQCADLFMFINIDQSWGLAVFEAMSCGLPVIVSESVGATEILSNNKNAIFVNPQDDSLIVRNIIELIEHPIYYKSISYNASEFHKDWGWDKAYCSKMLTLMKGN